MPIISKTGLDTVVKSPLSFGFQYQSVVSAVSLQTAICFQRAVPYAQARSAPIPHCDARFCLTNSNLKHVVDACFHVHLVKRLADEIHGIGFVRLVNVGGADTVAEMDVIND